VKKQNEKQVDTLQMAALQPNRHSSFATGSQNRPAMNGKVRQHTLKKNKVPVG
jgi:hypothetical protein